MSRRGTQKRPNQQRFGIRLHPVVIKRLHKLAADQTPRVTANYLIQKAVYEMYGDERSPEPRESERPAASAA